ncbi:MAG: pyrroline-5-carboxylate reductase [Bauldia sp.]|uniref:pyrroline-5-carboxylate reductase n=1 Tax=Bauldia sp. TaxID=2575872 RepID=UPI001D3127DF|nr:pyrroline-5-carboxylate reductase [Bauldia sp.]MCB1496884.1 pyrroline-5-carboxylate reductase [Bauldia sp.]
MTEKGPTPERPLVLVGAGKMGGALLAGWLDGGIPPDAIVVVEPSPAGDTARLLAEAGIATHASPPPDLTAGVVVLAIKPQIMGDALPALKSLVGPETTVLSIAAGTTLANLESGLGPAAIVRSIPNTPAQVGRGVTAAVANSRVGDGARGVVTQLLEAVGAVAWVEEEAMIDAVTAVSGSGPAYVFLFAECLTQAAVEAGLPRDVAERFARATVEGAGELLFRSELSPAELRKNVTSPNGTTAAALAVLMADDGLQPLVTRAVAAAKRRSEELSG